MKKMKQFGYVVLAGLIAAAFLAVVPYVTGRRKI